MGKKKFGETRDARRRRVELLLLSGKTISEISAETGYHEDTIDSDVEFLKEEWSKKPEAKDAYEKRVATLRAMCQYALEQSQSDKNPPATRIAWFQGWTKMSDELATLTGVGKYAERVLLIPESLQGQNIDHIQYAYRLFWTMFYEWHELKDEVMERGILTGDEVAEIARRGSEKARALEKHGGPYLDIEIVEGE